MINMQRLIKSIGKIRTLKIVSLTLLLSLFLVLGTAVYASNMGFKLNYGIVEAINKLLKGSGIHYSLMIEDDNAPAKTLSMDVDFANSPFVIANSNMGFKLNVISTGPNGLNIEAPNGDVLNVQVDNSNMGFKLNYTLKVPGSQPPQITIE